MITKAKHELLQFMKNLLQVEVGSHQMNEKANDIDQKNSRDNAITVSGRLEVWVGDIHWLDCPKAKGKNDLFIDIMIPTEENNATLIGTLKGKTSLKAAKSKFNQHFSFPLEGKADQMDSVYLIMSTGKKEYCQIGIAMTLLRLQRVLVSGHEKSEVVIFEPSGNFIGVIEIGLTHRRGGSLIS